MARNIPSVFLSQPKCACNLFPCHSLSVSLFLSLSQYFIIESFQKQPTEGEIKLQYMQLSII